MIAAGATPKAIQKVLGHGSAAFSLTVYGHLFDDDVDGLAEQLDAYLAASPRPRADAPAAAGKRAAS